MSDLRFPIGEFVMPDAVGSEERLDAINHIACHPAELATAVAGLDDAQLDTRYRPDGWTVRQVVHHLPDSHLNAYTRMKLALTESNPLIRTYEEAEWARLPDSAGPLMLSLELVRALHARWMVLWQSLTDDQWSRPFRHPELGPMNLAQLACFYSWHGRHHVAHITSLRGRNGW